MSDDELKALAISAVKKYLASNENELMSTIIWQTSMGSPIHRQLYNTVQAIKEGHYDDVSLAMVLALQINFESRI